MGKKSSKSPDVVGAANTEGEFSRETTRDQTYANRPDQYNALGSNTWQQQSVRDPATGEMTTKWTNRQNLSPEMQKSYNQDMYTNNRLGGMAASLTDRAESEISQPLDWSQFGEVEGMQYDSTEMRQRAEDNAYQKTANRLDPQMDAKRQELEIRLRNRGLSAGDQQYQSEMDSFNTGSNDAYEQARLGATAEGRVDAGQDWNQALQGNERANALRKQQIAEYTGKRGQTLGEIERLKGAQNTGEVTQTYGSA